MDEPETTPPADTPDRRPDLRGWGTEFRWQVEGTPEEGLAGEELEALWKRDGLWWRIHWRQLI